MAKPGEPFLNDAEQQLLLKIARDSMTAYVLEGRRIDLDDYEITPALAEPHGAFVTLRNSGELRGCIGYTESTESLAETVRDNAINAASRDPRFAPVHSDEVDAIHIEVSALCPGEQPDSPFIAVHDLSEIVIGRDGLFLEHRGPGGRGILLPQVPVEQGWDLRAYLDGICRKAGAPPHAWERPGAHLYRFSAQVFSEGEPQD